MKHFLSILFLLLTGVAYSQPTELLDIWKSVDRIQFLQIEKIVDDAFIKSPDIKANTKSVLDTKLFFGRGTASAIKNLANMQFVDEYELDGIAYKMRGQFNKTKNSAFIVSLNNIVCQDVFLLDNEYIDTESFKVGFSNIENALKERFGEPQYKNREGEKYASIISAIKNNSEMLYGNIYQMADGMIFMHPVRVFEATGPASCVKIFIYILHDKSLEAALKQ